MKNLTLIKQTVTLGFIGATVLFSPLATQALTVEEVNNPRHENGGWVTDMADILSNSTETELNNLINNLEKGNGAEIAVVTVPGTTSADSPKAFATQLFNHWGIGKADLDNGVLFLVSMGDKRVEIETGEGIESILSDTKIAQIIDTKITPQYKHENFDRGTLDGTQALISSLQSSGNLQDGSKSIFKTGNEIKTSLPNTYIDGFTVILICVLFLWSILDKAIAVNSGKRKRSRSSSHNNYTNCSGNSSSSGNFGGGSSNGGGAGGNF